MMTDQQPRSRTGSRASARCGFVVLLAAAGLAIAPAPAAAQGATWFEGALLLDGSGDPPVADSAFLVEDGLFTWVGRRGDREPPAGAARVDLSGKTVIPALIDAHQHLGLTSVKDGTHSKENYTRANLVEHLQRSAYHGVAATMSLGLEHDEALAFALRDADIPNAARFLTSGRGIAATSMAGPQQAYRLGIPRGAPTEAAGRAAVAELDALGAELVKIWVDDRGGTVPKLAPAVYRAIIGEAHARGMRVTAHLGSTSGLADAKDLIRAGVDGFAHTVRDRDIDDEYMALVREHPDVWTVPNLPGSPVTADDLPWLAETLPPFEVDNLRAEAERLAAEGPGASFELQCRNLARNREAGMPIGMGTDSGVSVAWTTHTELRDMARCGLTPMEVIVAATRVNAEILRLDDLGTVSAGKSASFVVLDANPLDDVTNSRRISAVYLGGEPVDREALRARFLESVR
ncbi:MAG: amidohydrolase family protein [Acidobacteria bacterium]|nr:amidohydrolase family protein [Acidobacteriota bacterium]